MLTADNLFDGTISTGLEQYYIEPSHRYSHELPKSGIHTIIYKLSDVKMDVHNHNNHKSDHETHCASEKLYRKMKQSENEQINHSRFLYNHENVNEKSDINLNNLKLNDDNDIRDDDDVISSRESSRDNQGIIGDSHKRMKRWLQVRTIISLIKS